MAILLIAFCLAGLSYGGITGFTTRRALEEARREHTALTAQSVALREQAFQLAEHVAEDLEVGRHIARLAGMTDRAQEGASLDPPPADVANETIVAWLSGQSVQLETLVTELATRMVENDGTQASIPVKIRARRIHLHNVAQ